MRVQLFLVGFLCVLILFFFGYLLFIVQERSAAAAPYFAGQTLFAIDETGLTVFGQTYSWP